MITFYARSGSLAALALALAFTLPATPVAAQDGPDLRIEAQPQARAERQQMRVKSRGGRAEARVQRSAPPARSAPVARPAPQRAAPAPRGFGADVMTRAQSANGAQQVDGRGENRADRINRRSEVRSAQVDRRSDVRAVRFEGRGDVRADQLDRRGRDGAANRVDRRSEVRADRKERRGDNRSNQIDYRGDRRAVQVEQRGDRRADRIDRRNEDRGGFGSDVLRRAERLDSYNDGRRDNWRGDRRGWRGDDRRDFRRWDRGWRGNQSYNWVDYRRANRFVYRPGPYFAPYRSHRYNRLQTGFFLDSLFFQPRFFINDAFNYRLPPVYGPYQWVRYYDDVMLVDIYTGEVVDVIHDFFW